MATDQRCLTQENLTKNKNEKILKSTHISGKKHVTFGRDVVLGPTSPDESCLKRDVTEKTGLETKTDDSNSDVKEVSNTFHITVKPCYNENNRPGSRVKYCQRLCTKGKETGALQNATDVTCLDNGHFIVTDMINSKLIAMQKDGTLIREYKADDISEPWALTELMAGKMAVTCRRSKCVTIIDGSDGLISRSFGQWFFKSPSGIASVSDRSVVVTDDVTNRVSVHDVESGKVSSYIGDGQSLKSPRYVTVSQTGDIIISDTGNHSVKVFDKNGNFLRQFGKYGSDSGCLKFPHSVCVDNFDNIYVSDYYNNRISVFNKDGRFCSHVATAIHGLQHPQAMTLTQDLRLLVTTGDLKATQVLIYDLDIRQT